MTESAKKAAKANRAAKRVARTRDAAKTTSADPTKLAAKKVAVKQANSIRMFRDSAAMGSSRTATRSTAKKSNGLGQDPGPRALPDSVSEETITRLIAEAESGIPDEKLRRRGRPAIGDEPASTYSVRLPDDLVSLVDGRSQIDGVTRGETIRRALIDYLTK